MRPVNLIPPELRRGDRAPLRSGPLAYVFVGVLLLAFLGVYVLVSTGNSISERKAEVVALEQELASSQARAEALGNFSTFATLEQTRTETVSALARSRFDWERVLRELALVIPDDVALAKLTGSVAAEADSGTISGAGVEAPTLTMSGCAPSHESVARMVAALRDIDGVTRVGLTNSVRGIAESSDVAPPSPPVAEGAAALGDSVCSGGPTSFEVTVAFDDVLAEPASDGIIPPEEAAPIPGDGSGVTETQQQREDAKGSVDSAQKESREAVDRYVPGT